MENDEIKKKTGELIDKAKELEKELKNLRNSCKHSEYTIKDANFGSGTLKLRKVCKFAMKPQVFHQVKI